MSGTSPKPEISAYDLLKKGGRAVDPSDQLRFRQAQDEREEGKESPTPGPSREREGGSDGWLETAHAPAPPSARTPARKLAPKPAPKPNPKPTPKLTPKPGHNHWTREKMVTFLRELAACQSVSRAAKAVGMSRQSAYRLRARMQGTPFALGWEVALEAGLHQLAHAVMDRAVNGVEVPQYYHGELVGTRRHFDERLSIWLLENPWKLGRHQVAREYSAEAFDALLERIEWAGLDWEAGEALPGPGAPLGTPEGEARAVEQRFTQEQSWYAAQVAQGDLSGRRR